MEDQSGFDACRSTLADKLKLMEDLWDKLVRVKWSLPSFTLLGRLAREMVKTARGHGETELTEAAARLERHIGACIAVGRMPEGIERGRLITLLKEMRYALTRPASATQAGPEGAGTVPAPSTAEVFAAVTDEAESLLAGLEDVGLQVRHLTTLAEAEAALAKTAPMALVIDVDFPDAPLAGIELVAAAHARGDLTAPVFFVGERDDFTRRIEAVSAGGSGYFTRPVDVSALVERLNRGVFPGSVRGDQRILIVDDRRREAEDMARLLEANGIVTQVIVQPLQVLEALQKFKPHLVLLDLDLKEISGLELFRMLRQHKAYETLPMILLCHPADLNQCLPWMEGEADDLLNKPVTPEYIHWVVRQRLRRAQALRAKFSTLSRRDAVSGLYNRGHFLGQLERTIATLGSGGTRSVTVMLVMLDNLRSVREATNVAAADEVVALAAARLKKVIDPPYQAARFGDAIFAVLITGAEDESLVKIARTVRTTLETGAYTVGEHTVQLHACIGIGVVTDQSQDFLTLIQNADLACSVAREQGGEYIHIHHPLSNREVEESHHHSLLEEIRGAVQYERMNLMFQPIASLRGDQQERYEVLLRMRDSEGRELLPEAVFGVAQRDRLGVALDRWVIGRSIELLRERRGRSPSTTLFVNISPATLQDEALHGWLKCGLTTAQVDGTYLVFEVAEQTARQHLDDMCRFVEAVRPLGCGLSLERFGRGPDSLGLLRTLRATYVKLDASFVQDLAGNEVKQEQLKKLVDSLQDLKTTTILGGIENLQTLPVLWSCGINYVQGFFLQRPHENMSYDFSGGAF